MLSVDKLKCAGMVDPIGIDLQNPTLSWNIYSEQRDTMQTAFRVIVCEDPAELKKENPVAFYDSGRIEGNENSVDITRKFVKSGTRYYWTVEVWDNHGNHAVAEQAAVFEVGLLYQKDWIAKWVEPLQHPVLVDRPLPFAPEDGVDSDAHMASLALGQVNDESVLFPCPILRRDFVVKGPVKSARIYATAHGVYRLELNGERVGNIEVAPECTPYHAMLQVQTYDVTTQLHEGANAIGAILGDGWWAGRIGNDGCSVQYGNKLALLMQMVIRYEDGTEEIIGTDEQFKSHQGPLRYSDMFMGEKYDVSYERKGWSKAGYPTRIWQPVEVVDYGYDNLVGQNAEPTRIVKTLSDCEVYISPRGEKMIDCKQVMFGKTSMHIKAAPYAEVKLTYTEETDQDRNFWLEIMGANSRHEDVVVMGASGECDYDPVFSGTGFRYIKVECNNGKVELSNIKAHLIASAVDETLQFECSDERVNRLNTNILWTLLSNMQSYPTDDCDRERAGFTGDAQMAFKTASYHLDARAFYRRWLKGMAHEQKENGIVPLVIPNWDMYNNILENVLGPSAGWSDACVIIPWFAYERYADKAMLKECYPMMKKWVSYVAQRATEANPQDIGEITPERAAHLQYLWNADFNFGDWLTPSACYIKETDTYIYWTQTLTHLTGTYFFAYDTLLMSKAAEALGYTEDAVYYKTLNERIREAAIKEIYNKGGILEQPYMGAHVMALHMGFCPQEDRQKVFDRLVELINEKGMDTGFISTTVVADVLSENGRADLAYKILLNNKFPSWLYEVENGATTVWETMQAIMPNGERQAVSFALTTFCAIGEWLIGGMGGIKTVAPGFKKIKLHPYLTDRLSYVKTAYESVNGKIRSEWSVKEGKLYYEVEVPANTEAEIMLPCNQNEIKESGNLLDKAEGVKEYFESADGSIIRIGSGSYSFAASL